MRTKFDSDNGIVDNSLLDNSLVHVIVVKICSIFGENKAYWLISVKYPRLSKSFFESFFAA